MFEILIFLAGLSAPPPSPVLTPEIAHAEERPIDVHQLVKDTAQKYHLNYEHLSKTIECESGFQIKKQSEYIKPDGTRERSFGIAQINLDAHPDITYEQATNPEWAMNWMGNEWSKDNAKIWSCWRQLYS